MKEESKIIPNEVIINKKVYIFNFFFYYFE